MKNLSSLVITSLLLLLTNCTDQATPTKDCTDTKVKLSLEESVTIENKQTHYRIEIDYTQGYTSTEIGKQYATLLSDNVTDFENIANQYFTFSDIVVMDDILYL